MSAPRSDQLARDVDQDPSQPGRAAAAECRQIGPVVDGEAAEEVVGQELEQEGRVVGREGVAGCVADSPGALEIPAQRLDPSAVVVVSRDVVSVLVKRLVRKSCRVEVVSEDGELLALTVTRLDGDHAHPVQAVLVPAPATEVEVGDLAPGLAAGRGPSCCDARRAAPQNRPPVAVGLCARLACACFPVVS